MRSEVDADSLAALMVLNRSLEKVPEPFRMQPDLYLDVCFDEYVRFIRILPDMDLLYLPTRQLKSFVEGRANAQLLKAFYIDMALAVGKELFFSEYSHRGATTIRHHFKTRAPQKQLGISSTTVLLLHKILGDKGFVLPATISARNQHHWQYACKLLQDAANGATPWVEN